MIYDFSASLGACEMISIARWDSYLVGVAKPLLVDIGEEGTVPALDVRLDNAVVRRLVADIFDLLTAGRSPVQEQVRLKLEAPWELVVDHDLSNLHHLFVHARIPIKEGLGSVIITDRLVNVKFMQEALEGRETMLSDSLTSHVQSEPILSLCVL